MDHSEVESVTGEMVVDVYNFVVDKSVLLGNMDNSPLAQVCRAFGVDTGQVLIYLMRYGRQRGSSEIPKEERIRTWGERVARAINEQRDKAVRGVQTPASTEENS